ncbi:MAG: cupin, partial [Pleurocapsa sp.]
PPQSKHTPGSEDGCIIFVKLWQFDLEDRHAVKISADEMPGITDPQREGVLIMPLYQDEREEVCIEKWSSYTEVIINTFKGAELLVLSGSLTEGEDELVTNSWLRVPINSHIIAKAGNHGAKVWIKKGHLPFISIPSRKITK